MKDFTKFQSNTSGINSVKIISHRIFIANYSVSHFIPNPVFTTYKPSVILKHTPRNIHKVIKIESLTNPKTLLLNHVYFTFFFVSLLLSTTNFFAHESKSVGVGWHWDGCHFLGAPFEFFAWIHIWWLSPDFREFLKSFSMGMVRERRWYAMSEEYCIWFLPSRINITKSATSWVVVTNQCT